MRVIIIAFLILSKGNLLFGQNDDFKNIEDKLILEFENYIESNHETRFDSLGPKLKKRVESVLANPESFDYPFNSLSKYVTIVESGDKRVRVFSWDELSGGTRHDIAVIVQYKTNSRKINTKWFNSDEKEDNTGFANAVQYEINTVKIDNTTNYLCFGWGTNGSGHQHNTIMIFSIVNESIEFCKSCISEDYSIIQAPRGEKTNISYDIQKQEISFREFKFNEDIGFFESTGKRIKLKLRDGRYGR